MQHKLLVCDLIVSAKPVKAADEISEQTQNSCQRTKKLGGGTKLDNAVEVKQKACKQWKSGSSKEEYLKAKKDEKAAVNFAKTDAQAKQFVSINSDSDNRIFKIAKRLK